MTCENGHNHAMTTGGNHDSRWQTGVHGHSKNEGQENILEVMDLAEERGFEFKVLLCPLLIVGP